MRARKLATPRRFERPTYRLGICRSILLSYGVSTRNQYLEARFCNRRLGRSSKEPVLLKRRDNLEDDARKKPGRRIACKKQHRLHDVSPMRIACEVGTLAN